MGIWRNYDKTMVDAKPAATEQTYDKENVGMGLGGNPQDMTTQTTGLNDSKDTSGLTITPPQPAPPRQLTKNDFIDMMNGK
jgi:hypothetical protein